MLTFPVCGNAFTGCGLPFDFVRPDGSFGTALFPFKGFRVAFVTGILRGQVGGIDADPSEDKVVLEMVKVSFKSEFDCDNTLEVDDADEVELVRRRRGLTPKPGGFIPLWEGTDNYRGKNKLVMLKG